MDKVFEELSKLCHLSAKQLSKENFQLLEFMELKWKGKENQLISLIKKKNKHLAYGLIEQIYLGYGNNKDLVLDIGPINWWLKWFIELQSSKKNSWFLQDRLSGFSAKSITRLKRTEFIDEFNNPKSPYRTVLAYILSRFDDISLGEISNEGIDYLIDNIVYLNMGWGENLLEKIATETIVIERLLPLLNNSKGLSYITLVKVLNNLGRKNGRRYITD